MSRSYRQPTSGASKGHKQWKSQSNHKIRINHDLELSSGNYYRRLNEIWTSPAEHQGHWLKDDPKAYRK